MVFLADSLSKLTFYHCIDMLRVAVLSWSNRRWVSWAAHFLDRIFYSETKEEAFVNGYINHDVLVRIRILDVKVRCLLAAFSIHHTLLPQVHQ